MSQQQSFSCFICDAKDEELKQRRYTYDQIAFSIESSFFGHPTIKHVCRGCQKDGITPTKAYAIDNGEELEDE